MPISPEIKIFHVYFNPEVTHPGRLYGVQIMKIRPIKNFTKANFLKEKTNE
jgi:hypothetical protein